MNETRTILAAWGCPDEYQEPGRRTMRCSQVRGAARAINGYDEHHDALQAMWDAGDSAAVRAWSESEIWETVARETGDDDPDEIADYAEGVRSALRAMADAIDAGLSLYEHDRMCYRWARDHQGFEGTPKNWLSLTAADRDEYEIGAGKPTNSSSEAHS